MVDRQLETLAYRLKDLATLRNLFSELNFDFADKPVNKDSWNEEQKNIVQDAKIIASKDDYKIYYIQTNTDSLKQLKGIASKIIKENHGLCMICSHNPSGIKWIFSSLSKEFSKNFSETRHVPIDIKPDTGASKTFVDFLEKIRVNNNSAGISIVSQVSEAFDSFAIQIHDELTVNVFEALKVLSEGIILDKSNELTLNEETIKEIREHVFVLLYRIIFILYAEDRGIFPTEQQIYEKKFSFKWLKQEWLIHPENQKKLSEYDVQERLWGFFRLIELGSEDLGYDSKEFFMRSYYGRLFDRKINSKLEQWKIPNSFLLEATSLLTRTRDKKGNYFFLDYSALDTRHLGSIYEHLLEFHLTIKNKRIEALVDPTDRKTSGSFFTPKAIIVYIVKNTIGPAIDKIIRENKDKHVQIEKILELKILDPAMGSGHFLIGAVEYMATRLCEIEFENILEPDYIERKRDVVRRCIYGVDINPLSVDLARLSLWLETISSDKPLSFLSAHLKAGNSLIGSDLPSLFEKQTTLFEAEKGRNVFKKNLKKFLMFEGLEDDSPSAVKMKLEEYSKMQSKGTLYYDLKFLLNCKTAEGFGIIVPNLGDYRAKIGENSLDFYTDENYPKVKKIADENSFFHWDLEFPQIFYDENGIKMKTGGGFDIIIGNPPYGAELTNQGKKYLDKKFQIGSVDTAQLMMKCSHELLRLKGNHGFIVPKALIYAHNWTKIREYFLPELNIVLDVGKVWKEVKLEQSIYTITKNSSSNSYQNGVRNGECLQTENEINKKYVTMFGFLLSNISSKELELGEKIFKNSKRLNEYLTNSRGSIYQKLVKEKAEVSVIGGKQIQRFHMAGIYGHMDKKDIDEKKAHVTTKSILVQRLVAHVMNPVDHIKITATIPDKEDFVILDTVNQLKIFDDSISPYYILGLLNSKFINWYVYRFIFGKAIRTMQFDNPVTNRIPIIIANQEDVINCVQKLLDYNKKLFYVKQKHGINIKTVFDVEKIDGKSLNIQDLKFNKLKKNTSKISKKKISEQIKYFDDEKNKIVEIIEKITNLENELNQLFYTIFKLTKDEIILIE